MFIILTVMVCNICTIELVLGDQAVSTSTILCTEGTFYSALYLRCIPCSTCDSFSTIFSPCTASSDTVCLRCTDTSRPEVVDHPGCKQCPPCQAGEYMLANCTSSRKTVCAACQTGSFSAHASYKRYCQPCSECKNREMIKDCTLSEDTVCGSCKKGFYRDADRNTCFRCSSCAPGQEILNECRGGVDGKLCAEYVYVRTDYVGFAGGGGEIVSSTPSLREGLSTNGTLQSPTTDSARVITWVMAAAILTTFLIVILLIALPKVYSSKKRQDKTQTLHGSSDLTKLVRKNKDTKEDKNAHRLSRLARIETAVDTVNIDEGRVIIDGNSQTSIYQSRGGIIATDDAGRRSDTFNASEITDTPLINKHHEDNFVHPSDLSKVYQDSCENISLTVIAEQNIDRCVNWSASHTSSKHGNDTSSNLNQDCYIDFTNYFIESHNIQDEHQAGSVEEKRSSSKTWTSREPSSNVPLPPMRSKDLRSKRSEELWQNGEKHVDSTVDLHIESSIFLH